MGYYRIVFTMWKQQGIMPVNITSTGHENMIQKEDRSTNSS